MAIQDFDFKNKQVKNPKLKQIIVAVDNDADMGVLTNTLREKRIPVIGTAKEERAALELVRKHKVGVLFLDGDFKNIDIEAILQKMKINFPEFRVAIISGSPTRELVDAATTHGAIGFLTKPIKKEAVLKIASHI